MNLNTISLPLVGKANKKQKTQTQNQAMFEDLQCIPNFISKFQWQRVRCKIQILPNFETFEFPSDTPLHWLKEKTMGHFRKCSRKIIVTAQVGAVKIYVAAVEALRKTERQCETQEPSKLMFFWVSPTTLNANVCFCRFFLESHPVYDQTQGTGATV